MKNIIGIDIGGTDIKAGIVSRDGKVSEFYSSPTEASKGKEKVIDNIIHVIEHFTSKHKIKGIGIGAPGPFKDLKKGIFEKQLNLPLNDVNLKKAIKKKTGFKIEIANDANCFALAEAKLGKGKRYSYILGITLGTGIGTGLIIDKEIYTGRGNALEFSSISLDPKKGTRIEDSLGRKGIEKIALSCGIKIKEPKELYELAKAGNKAAIKSWDIYGRYLGNNLANLTMAFDPDIIIIGGNVSRSWRFFEKSMKKEMKAKSTFRPPNVVKSTLEEPGIIGAAQLLL